ncbi:MAG: hypothetical protein JKX72_06980 [Robiginitomaculum sp.]|nr:hypothetical protein [Robiginitomaculum sp.]
MRIYSIICVAVILAHISTIANAQNKSMGNVPQAKMAKKIKASHMRARIGIDVPAPHIRLRENYVRMSANHTPSGFQVPRYVSLKYGASNGRTGPSRAHPVAWRYKRRGLPMIVVAETELWRKVRDVNGDESWMNRRLLSGKSMVLARSEIILRAKPKSDSRSRAIAAKGALLELHDCDQKNWCLVTSGDGHISGYAIRSLLWGAETL